MRDVIVQYKTTPTYAGDNAAKVKAVFAELASKDPGGLRYRSYQLPDGVTFVHVATLDSDNPLPSLAAFKAFQAGLEGNCVERPVVHEVTLLGAYEAPR